MCVGGDQWKEGWRQRIVCPSLPCLFWAVLGEGRPEPLSPSPSTPPGVHSLLLPGEHDRSLPPAGRLPPIPTQSSLPPLLLLRAGQWTPIPLGPQISGNGSLSHSIPKGSLCRPLASSHHVTTHPSLRATQFLPTPQHPSFRLSLALAPPSSSTSPLLMNPVPGFWQEPPDTLQFQKEAKQGCPPTRGSLHSHSLVRSGQLGWVWGPPWGPQTILRK